MSRYHRRDQALKDGSLYDTSCFFDFFPDQTAGRALTELAYEYLEYPDQSGLPVKLHHFFV